MFNNKQPKDANNVTVNTVKLMPLFDFAVVGNCSFFKTVLSAGKRLKCIGIIQENC